MRIASNRCISGGRRWNELWEARSRDLADIWQLHAGKLLRGLRDGDQTGSKLWGRDRYLTSNLYWLSCPGSITTKIDWDDRKSMMRQEKWHHSESVSNRGSCGLPKANFQWLTWRGKEVKVNLPVFPAIKERPLLSFGRFKGGSWKYASASYHHQQQCLNASSSKRVHDISVVLSLHVLFSTSLMHSWIVMLESQCCKLYQFIGLCLILYMLPTLLLKMNGWMIQTKFEWKLWSTLHMTNCNGDNWNSWHSHHPHQMYHRCTTSRSTDVPQTPQSRYRWSEMMSHCHILWHCHHILWRDRNMIHIRQHHTIQFTISNTVNAFLTLPFDMDGPSMF